MLKVDVLVRDDGSTDSTVGILKEYEIDGKLRYYVGNNIGPAQSFRDLIATCCENYFAYAYADQDDIWSTDKLVTAVSEINDVMKKCVKPVLWYCGIEEYYNGKVTNSYCCPIERAKDIKTVLMTFATTNGCTMVFNKDLLMYLKKCIPGRIDMHDSWTNVVCLAVGGNIIFSNKNLVKYRIHENQVLGGRKKKSFRLMLCPSRLRGETVRMILNSNLVNEEYQSYFKLLANCNFILNKCKILFSGKPEIMSNKEYWNFMFKVIFNAY